MGECSFLKFLFWFSLRFLIFTFLPCFFHFLKKFFVFRLFCTLVFNFRFHEDSATGDDASVENGEPGGRAPAVVNGSVPGEKTRL